MKHLSSATTRTLHAQRSPAGVRRHLLARSQVVKSPESGLQYRVVEMIGEGGFGQAFLARRLGRSSRIADTVCIKASTRIDGWLREAYFGQVLAGHPRAIQVYDAFPLIETDGSSVYFLVLEYARHGDLRLFLRRNGKEWNEKRARNEIAGVLEVLRKLHRGQTLHRDLTPLNLFVCDGPTLKLGDFGITRPQSDRRGVSARTMSALTAPSEILAGAVPKWQARDDVYQVGQLLAMLMRGDADRRVRTSEVRALPCSDHMKEIVHRCIGERRKRYDDADELIDALRNPPAVLRVGALRSLKGVHLAFTGTLQKKRADAAKAARRAGAVIHHGPSARTTVIVRGRPNALQAAGRDAGLKLMEIKRLREKGHKVTVLDEARFWRLVTKR